MAKGKKLPEADRLEIVRSPKSAKALASLYGVSMRLIHKTWLEAGRPGSHQPYKRHRRVNEENAK